MKLNKLTLSILIVLGILMIIFDLFYLTVPKTNAFNPFLLIIFGIVILINALKLIKNNYKLIGGIFIIVSLLIFVDIIYKFLFQN